jgi:hypothetical protein
MGDRKGDKAWELGSDWMIKSREQLAEYVSELA